MKGKRVERSIISDIVRLLLMEKSTTLEFQYHKCD
jgi:hypothetical protein